MEIKDCSSKEINDDQLKNASGGYMYCETDSWSQSQFKFTSDEADKLRSQGHDIKPARVYTRGDLNRILRTDASDCEAMRQILERKGLSPEERFH